MTKPRKRVRKPCKDSSYSSVYSAYVGSWLDKTSAELPSRVIGPKEARRLAKWLIAFADWAESKEAREGK